MEWRISSVDVRFTEKWVVEKVETVSNESVRNLFQTYFNFSLNIIHLRRIFPLLGTFKTRMWYCICDNKDGCNFSSRTKPSNFLYATLTLFSIGYTFKRLFIYCWVYYSIIMRFSSTSNIDYYYFISNDFMKYHFCLYYRFIYNFY